jgi:hypothetical protein
VNNTTNVNDGVQRLPRRMTNAPTMMMMIIIIMATLVSISNHCSLDLVATMFPSIVTVTGFHSIVATKTHIKEAMTTTKTIKRTTLFSTRKTNLGRPVSRLAMAGTTILEPPTKERVYTSQPDSDRSTRSRRRYDGDEEYDNNNNDDDDDDDMEYYLDAAESREMDDPFHILLMQRTFDKPRITIPYVASSLQYVLDMPHVDAIELSTFAREQGMSCLGMWPRKVCLELGKQLQRRDLICRVVPYATGGQRGWQAKNNAFDSSSSSSSTAADFNSNNAG